MTEHGMTASARATGSKVRLAVMLVRHHLGGGVEDWLVHFFWWRRCGGKEERATGLGKNMWQAWC
jgi:hypothetical protein